MKRNQVYNSNYEAMLREMEKRAKETSIPLEHLVKGEDTNHSQEQNDDSENKQKEDDKQFESLNEQVQASEQIPNET